MHGVCISKQPLCSQWQRVCVCARACAGAGGDGPYWASVHLHNSNWCPVDEVCVHPLHHGYQKRSAQQSTRQPHTSLRLLLCEHAGLLWLSRRAHTGVLCVSAVDKYFAVSQDMCCSLTKAQGGLPWQRLARTVVCWCGLERAFECQRVSACVSAWA